MDPVEAGLYRTLTRWICITILVLLGYVAAYNIVDRTAPVRYVSGQNTWIK